MPSASRASSATRRTAELTASDRSAPARICSIAASVSLCASGSSSAAGTSDSSRSTSDSNGPTCDGDGRAPGLAGGADRGGERRRQAPAELDLHLVGAVLERPQHPAGGLLGDEVAAVVGEHRGRERLRRRLVERVLVGVVVQQDLEVLGQPRRQPAAQRLDEVGDRHLQLAGQALAVDRRGPEALGRLAVDDGQQHHAALVAGLAGQRRDERRDRQAPRQRQPLATARAA